MVGVQLSELAQSIARKDFPEMIYYVSSGTLNSTHSLTPALNPLTAMKKIIPTAIVFWSKSNFFNYIRQRQNITDARYQYIAIYRWIYPAVGG